MAAYGSPAYWDDRYRRDPEPFDWYQRYSALKEVINKYINKGQVVLVEGCGTSRLSEDMYEDGYNSIINIDYAAPAIEIMAARTKGKDGLTWQVMDGTSLAFPDVYFDAVVDKATLDSVLCGENSTANATKMCSEVARVLKPGGKYLVVSYGQPESRLTYLEKEEYKWKVTVHTLRK